MERVLHRCPCGGMCRGGVVIIPKSVHRERMEENLNIWDFVLSDADMEAIRELDLGHSEIIDHSAADTAKFLNGWKIHE